ncbi:MAG: hypothetical protein JJU16_11870 [Alkalibacterium sp.]|nr:hypothetical protein [Alkalibacterium sp.]
MNKLAKLTALTMTAGMLLAACGDADNGEVDDTLPGTEEPADDGMDDGLEDDGMDDGLEDDMDDEDE